MSFKIVFGIDDIAPISAKSFGKDFGGDLEQGILGQLIDFSKEFPKIKYTLFITPNYSYKSQLPYLPIIQKVLGKVAGKSLSAKLALKLSGERFCIEKHKNFCNFLRKFSRKKLFSLELHGFDHFNPFNYSQEFFELSVNECSERISKSLLLFKKVGFEKPCVFAPPGWFVSGNLMEALRENGFKIIAGSIDNSHGISKNSFSKGSGLQCVSALFPQKTNGLLNIPRNWDLRFGSLEKAMQIAKAGGILGIHAHAAEEGVQNAITSTNLSNLYQTLEFLEKNFGNLNFFHFKDFNSYVSGVSK